MILELINKGLMTLFFMSCLNVIRHLYYFIQALVQATEDEPYKYKLSNRSLILLSLSLGFILAVIFKGINI